MENKPHTTAEKITAAALHLAKNEGWKETTIRRICQEAGVSIGSFYHHFKNKQEVVNKSFMMFDRTLTTTCDDCQNPVDEVKNTVMKQAEFIVVETGKVTAEYYAVLLMGDDYLAANPNRVFYKKLVAHIEDAKKDGYLKDEYDAKYIAEFLIKFNRGAIIDWCLGGNKFDILKRLDKELDLVLSIFLVE